MIIDAHIHLWDKVEGDEGGEDAPVRALRNGIIKIGDREMLGMPPYFLDGRCPYEMALAVMDAAGVDAAVVTQEYHDGNQNAYLTEVQEKYPGRFFTEGLLEFRQPDSLTAEFSDLTQKYGFKGIKLPAGYLVHIPPRIFLTDKRLMAVFEQMENRQMILTVELDYGDIQVKELREAARAFPELTIIVGHFGLAGREGWLEQLSLAEEPNVYMESGGITWLFRHEGPPFPGAQEVFREAVNRVGADKLMWGSDFPRTQIDFTYEQTLDFLIDGCDFLAEDQREAILGGTAARVFDFKEPPGTRQRPMKYTELD